MKERKTIKKILTRYVPRCVNITFGDMVADYDKALNRLIEEEYSNGWDLVEYTTKVGEYEANIVYNLIFEKYEIKEDDNKPNARLTIDTSFDDEFKRLVKSENTRAPKYIKDTIKEYMDKYDIKITREYECVNASDYQNWIDRNKDIEDIPRSIPITDVIIGTIIIKTDNDTVRGFVTYCELFKFDKDLYRIRTIMEGKTTVIKVFYFKPIIGLKGD